MSEPAVTIPEPLSSALPVTTRSVSVRAIPTPSINFSSLVVVTPVTSKSPVCRASTICAPLI